MNTQQRNKILSKAEVFTKLNQSLLFPAKNERFIVHLLNLTDNRFAPEDYAYKVSYLCSFTGKRNYGTFYPHTLGLQGRSKLKGTLLA